MLKSIVLEKFKCFLEEIEIPLAKVTIMYGKNGRGKSTASQALLLIAQSMRKANDLNELVVNGELVKLGAFDELLYNSESDHFSVGINAEKEHLVANFQKIEGISSSGKLSRLNVNDVERLDTISGFNSSLNEVNVLAGVTSTSDIKILQDIKNCLYVSADRNGPQNSQKRIYTSVPLSFNPIGENIIQIIAERGKEFQIELKQALSEIMDGANLSVPETDSEVLELRLNSADGEKSFKPINVGYGYSYVLPVVVASMIAEPGSILIIENPEAHLHPGAQSRLAKFLISNAIHNDYQLIIESHSDHVVNGLRISAKEGVIHPKDCIIDYFYTESKTGKAAIDTITCDIKGTLSNYPDDFMDEWTLQLLKLV